MKQPNCCTRGNTPVSVTHEALMHCRQSHCSFLKEAEITDMIILDTSSVYPDCEYCLDSILEMESRHLENSLEM